MLVAYYYSFSNNADCGRNLTAGTSAKKGVQNSMKILFLADTHCGHVGGLTPPEWRASGSQFPEWTPVAEKAWKKFYEIVCGHKWDVCCLLGDLIDGRAEKDGGQELHILTPEKQSECALHILQKYIKAEKYCGVYGTPYHTGQLGDVEKSIFNALGCAKEHYGDCLKVKIGGKIFDLRHDIGGSSTPVGGDISLRKEVLTDREWCAQHGAAPADCYIRAHVHYCREISDGAGWRIWTCPSLQLWTRFGRRSVHGRIVHWGVLWCEIDDGNVTFYKQVVRLCEMKSLAPVEL